MAVWVPLDETVQPESAEVIGHRPRRIGGRIAALELCDVIAKLPMSEAGRGQREETEGVHEGVHAAIAKAQTGRPLLVDTHR